MLDDDRRKAMTAIGNGRHPRRLRPIGRKGQLVTLTMPKDAPCRPVPAAAAKAKYMTGERILTQHALRLRRQAVEPLAHVGGTRRQPHWGARRQTRSSQHFDNLPQRLGADLAAQTHPPPTPRRDLDDALAIRPPRPTVIGRDLDRHPLFYQNRVFIPRAPAPCAVQRDKWFRSRLGPSARPKTGPPASGRCWNNDHRQPVFGLRRARPRRARSRR